MLKFTESIRKKIHAFNQYCSSLPKQDAEGASKKTKLKLAKENWRFFAGDGLSSAAFKYSLLDPIKADSGSSGFLAPPEIMEKLRKVDENDIVEYSDNRVPDNLCKYLTSYCQEEKIISPDVSISPDVLTDTIIDNKKKYAVMGNGTHSIITILFSTLIKSPGDVIVITDPTYGLLLNPITNAGGNYKAFPLEEAEGFKPNPQKLKDFILQKNTKLKNKFLNDLDEDLLCRFFKNTDSKAKAGLKRLFEELKAKLALSDLSESDDLIEKINSHVKEHYNKEKHSKLKIGQHLLKKCPRVRGFLNINPQTPAGSVLEKKDVNEIANALNTISDLAIIDDLTHKDIMLSNKEAGAFSASSMANKTVAVFSFSKNFALAGIRAGIGIGPQSLIKPITETIFEQQSMISTYSVKALKTVLKLPKVERDKYISENNEVYAFRKDLMLAIINGINSITDKDLKEDIKSTVQKLPNFKKEYKDQLLKGIPGLSLVNNNPEGGFFVQLDLSHFKGKYLGQQQLNTSIHFHQAFDYLSDLCTIPNELNFHFDKPSLRFAVTMTETEICEAMLRIKGILSLLTDQPKEMLKKESDQANKAGTESQKTGKKAQHTVKQPTPKDKAAEMPPTPKGKAAEMPPTPKGKAAEMPPTPKGKAAEMPPTPKGKAAEMPPTPKGKAAEMPPRVKTFLKQFAQKKRENPNVQTRAKANEILKKMDLPIAARKAQREAKRPSRFNK